MNKTAPSTNCIDEVYNLIRKLDIGSSYENKKYTTNKNKEKCKIDKNEKTYSVETNYLKYTKLFEKGYSAVEVADMTKGQLSYIRNCQTLWRKQMV